MSNLYSSFPDLAIWIAAKRTSKYASGFVFATALYFYFARITCIAKPSFKSVGSILDNILGGLLAGGWLFALAYAI